MEAARGVRPSLVAISSLMMSAADAPSVSGDELPGVMTTVLGEPGGVLLGVEGGLRPARPSAVVEARSVSSTVCCTCSPAAFSTVIGTISLSKYPAS